MEDITESLDVDLCVSAALDAVKECVELPWSVPKPGSSPDAPAPEVQPSVNVENETGSSDDSSNAQPRVLLLRHFTKALKEISPSSSESLGTLTALRKWNEEFGEGRKDRRRKSIWGRGRFGFTDRDAVAVEEGRVVTAATPSAEDTGPRL